jgi:nitroreductase
MNPHLTPWNVQPDHFPADGFASDRLEFLLAYAVLAPSPHNTQPWLFRINTSDVEIFADPRRVLPVADPHRREQTLACGCALYNLRVAAHYFGQGYTVEAFPDPHQPDLMARFTLRGPTETASEDIVLFQAITGRRTNREAFQPDPIAEEILTELTEASAAEGAWLAIVTDDDTRKAIAELVAQADRTQWSNHGFRKELASWIRTDAEHQADGIPTRELGFRDWMSFAGPALVRTFNRGDNQAAHDAEIASHSPAIGVLGTYEDDPGSWLRAGQALESVLLHAQSEGLSVSHLNQPIEVADLRPAVGKIVDRDDFPQVILRLGYGPPVGPTPRRNVHSRLLMQDPTKAPPH